MLRLLILVLSILLITTTAMAERWVQYDKTTKYVVGKYSGDGYRKGICGKNNTSIISGYILATEDEYMNVGRFKKVDLSVITGSRVVDMTQVEKDAILQAEADAQTQAESEAIDRLEVTQLEVITALIKRINVRIPSKPITKAEIVQQIKDDR